MLRILNFLRWILAIAGFSLFCVTIIVLGYGEWQKPSSHLLWRGASYAIYSTSHTWTGFWIFWVAAPAIVWLCILGYKWNKCRREGSMAPLKSAFLDSTEALEMIPLGIIVAVWLILFGFGIARIVYDDHQGLVGTVSQLKSTNAGLTTDNGELSEQNKKLKKSGRVQPQDLPLKITVLQYGAWDYTLNGQKGTAYFVLAITNRTISPVHVTMMCDKDFVKFDAGLLVTRNNPIVSVGPGHISQPTSRSYEYATQSPPWTPESPLGFGIFTDSKNLKCDVVQNP